MCIGIPLQVRTVEPGHALCVGRGGPRRVGTALVGEVAVGDWLLVFLDQAQQRIDEQRAAEIEATLALLEAAQTDAPIDLPVGFELPSQTTRAQWLEMGIGCDAETSASSPHVTLSGDRR